MFEEGWRYRNNLKVKYNALENDLNPFHKEMSHKIKDKILKFDYEEKQSTNQILASINFMKIKLLNQFILKKRKFTLC